MFVRRSSVVVFLIAFFAVWLPLTASAAPRIKLATMAPRGTSFHLSLQQMAESWRQAPDGGVTLTIYTDGTMGSEADVVGRMRVGQIQAAMLTAIGLAEIDPAAAALQFMPMTFRSMDELEYVRARLEPKLSQRLLDKGYVVLFWADAGWVRYFSRQEGTRPDEFRKMKLFALATDNNQIDIMKAAGYRPVPLEWADTLTALQTGMVDVIPTAPFHALAGQFYSVAPNMLEVNWVPLIGATVVQKKVWDGLTPAAREAMMKAAQQAGQQIQASGRRESQQAVEAMQKRGLKVHPVSAAAEAEWHNAVQQVYPKIRGSMVPADVFDEVLRIVAEYRSRPQRGR